MRALALAVAVSLVAALAAFGAPSSSIAPITRAQGRAILQAREWHKGCPVVFSQLRVLTVRYYGFDQRTHWGRLVVNARFAAKLQTVFAKLYTMRFAIHHMQFGDTYGALNNLPKDGDFTASFECREASASPCTGSTANKTTGSWSMHAYGEAIDLNPVENPYVGCGMTRDKTALSFLHRSNVRRGMVTPAVVAAFASIGWGWGGSWFGSTKDYMHFSANGH
jgi:D-alanyl-D-alanine carboxypeptidase